MRSIIISLVVLVGSSAHAQDPDQQPYPPPPPMQPQPQPQPQPYPPQPQPQPMQPQPYQPQPGYAPPQGMVPIQLSADDHAILQRGEIPQNMQLVGAVANTFLAFGIGQAIQGRWGETGWIFTLGQGASIALMIGGAVRAVECDFDQRCNNNGAAGALIAGAIGFTVFYIWGIVDAVTGPAAHNRRVRELRMRLGIPQPMWSRPLPYLDKARDGGGGTAGLVFRF
jgi:hypothetical protein